MKLTIDNTNYKAHIIDDKFILLDNKFIKDNNLGDNDEIEIKGIDDGIIIAIQELNSKQLAISLSDLSLESFHVSNSQIVSLKIVDVIVSKPNSEKYKAYKTIIEASEIGSFWNYFSTFYNGVLFRNKSRILDLSYTDCKIDYYFSFINSYSTECISFESSEVDAISIEPGVSKEGEKLDSALKTFQVFRTEVAKEIKIYNTEVHEIHFHKIKVCKSESLKDYFNHIFISTPDTFEKVQEIKITESIIPVPLVISFNTVNKFSLYENTLSLIRVNFWLISDFEMDRCNVSENAFWGFPQHLKTIEKFVLTNCIFQGDFYLTYTAFKNEMTIQTTIFEKYPSYFSHNAISETCLTDFTDSKIDNLVFQKIHLEHFSFNKIDITNIQFRDCYWKIQKSSFAERIILTNEKNNNLDNLLLLKDTYSQLKENFRKRSDYLTSGMFYISEQEIKRKIAKKSKQWLDYFYITVHKLISSYGESAQKPLFLLFIILIVMAFVFLFTGFNSDLRAINYELTFQPENALKTLRDWVQALIFSIKNILPMPINNRFYLFADGSQKLTQTFELLHKIINLILLASFTEALLKYLKK